MNILPPEAMRAWEARETAAGRADAAGLMRAAVDGCARFLLAWPDAPRRLLVLAGKGNNGNDGLLLAATLRAAGWDVRTVLADPPESRRPCAWPEVAAEAARAAVWPALPVADAEGGRWTVADALLGSGASNAPRGACAELITWAAAWKARHGGMAVALDAPSGLGTEGPVFPAEATLALGAVQPACLRDAHRALVGRIVPVLLPLGTAPEPDRFITPEMAARWVRPLPAALHKYRRGTVAVWAGVPGMAGAAVLAARAAVRAGAGLVRLFTHPELAPVLAAAVPEVQVASVDAGTPFPETLVGAPVLLAGPGVGRSPQAARLLRRLAEETRAALVLDADALTLAAADESLFSLAAGRPVVATPHAGEWGRFFQDVPAEREEVVDALRRRHSGVVWVAKGPNTLVGAPDGLTWNGTGNPGMAAAGMGDVLGGMVATLLARGHPAPEAARLAVCWHGLAADLAARTVPEAVLTAGDVLEHLPQAWAALAEHRRG